MVLAQFSFVDLVRVELENLQQSEKHLGHCQFLVRGFNWDTSSVIKSNIAISVVMPLTRLCLTIPKEPRLLQNAKQECSHDAASQKILWQPLIRMAAQFTYNESTLFDRFGWTRALSNSSHCDKAQNRHA